MAIIRHGRAILRGEGHDPNDYAPQPDNFPVTMYFTYRQAALLCNRPESAISALVTKHNMKRYLVPHRRWRRRVLLPASTVRRVREMLLGVP